eukprot:2896665-Pyramimonas_sp.AAC.1
MKKLRDAQVSFFRGALGMSLGNHDGIHVSHSDVLVLADRLDVSSVLRAARLKYLPRLLQKAPAGLLLALDF